MPRQRRQRGQLIPRGDVVGARVHIGQGRYQWLGTFADHDAAQQACDAFYRDGAMPNNETVRSFAERWVRDYPRPKVSTNSTYTYQARAICGAGAIKIGSRLVTVADLRMADLTRPVARAFALAHPGLRAPIRTMFRDALEDGIVTANPFANLRLPQSKGRAEIEPLTAPEVELLADTALSVWATRRPDQQHFAPASCSTCAGRTWTCSVGRPRFASASGAGPRTYRSRARLGRS